MSYKENKPQVSVDSLKDIVKRLKTQGFQSLTHHDLAIAITTIGFKQVCKQFGSEWSDKLERQALSKLAKSEYEISWFGKINNSNYVPFLQLCVRGDIEKVKQFMFTLGKGNKNQLISTTDNFKRTALHLAVKEGFDVLAQYLIKEGFSVNSRDRQLKTPLHYCKNQLICQLLLKKGANVVSKDNKGCTPVHLAASGSEYKVLQLMLKKTNVVNQKDSTLKTALFYAIYNVSEQQINVIRVILQNGGKINEVDMNGKTPLHYAAEMGKSRCIPILLQKGASIDIRDKYNKTALDLAANDKIKKIITAYCEGKGYVFEQEENQKREDFGKILNDSKVKPNASKVVSKEAESSLKQKQKQSNGQAYTKQVNQVSTWVRQKFFVLMKKLQQSGIKALWHLKRPYIYTGSWAEDVEGLQELYESFLNINGPEAAMRTFNILCPYEKPLPNVARKPQEAFQSFFGQNWFSNDPVEKIRNMHSQTKIRSQLQLKIKENEDLKNELLGYSSQMQKQEGIIMSLKEELNHYQKIQQQLRRERTKNTQQYAEILKHLNQISNLKQQISQLSNGQEKTQILSNMVEELRSKNEDLIKQISMIKVNEAAARRKCGQLFLKSIAMAKTGQSMVSQAEQGNLYDDDAIINLYDLLKDNPPNLQKRFKLADRRGQNKLNIEQFTKLLQTLSMLPQDVMSMHRITGFAFGRKTLSLQEFKTILQNRHKNRPMWQKQLIRKLKAIILGNNITLDKFFTAIDADGSGTIEASQLRKGLQSYNIFMNQSDWSNLFNLLDSDKSGTIQLEEMKNLFMQQSTGKLEELGSVIKNEEANQQKNSAEQNQKQKQEEEHQSQHDQDQDNKSEKIQNEGDKEEDNQQQNKQENNEDQNKDEENQQQEQSIQKSQNKLLSQQQQNQSQYQEQDQDAQAGLLTLNGQIRFQVPLLLIPDNQEKVYLRFMIGDVQNIKMADLSLPKLKVSLIYPMIQYKTLPSDLKLHLTVFKTRQFIEENYLGQILVELQGILELPNDYGINKRYNLEASEFDKQVGGEIVLQAKWIPKTQ